MKTSIKLAALVSALACMHVYADGSTNVISNGDFSDSAQLSGWTATGDASITFNPYADAERLTGSGAMVIAQGNSPETATSKCALVSPGSDFTYGARWQGYRAVYTELGNSTITFGCSSYSDNACTVSKSPLVPPNSDYWLADQFFSTFATFPTEGGTLGNDAHSVNCSVTVSGGQLTTAYVDNVFFNVTPPSTINLGGYLSGNWYDPANGGQGFQLEFTSQANTLLATWFTYSLSGQSSTLAPIWIIMQGTYDTTKNSVTVPAYYLHGSEFPPLFHSENVITDDWGTVTFTFFDCNHGTVSWNPTIVGYQPGSMAISRLTSIAGTSCPQ